MRRPPSLTNHAVNLSPLLQLCAATYALEALSNLSALFVPAWAERFAPVEAAVHDGSLSVKAIGFHPIPGLAWVQWLLVVLAIFAGARWLFEARRRLHYWIPAHRPALYNIRSNALVVLGFVVPVLNLVVPYFVFRQLWLDSSPDHSTPSLRPVYRWWAAWVGMMVLLSVTGPLGAPMFVAQAIRAGCSMAAAWFAASLVRQIETHQLARMRGLMPVLR